MSGGTASRSSKREAANSACPVVLSVAYPFAVVGPCAVGGAEVVLSELEAALPGLGFRSVVVAQMGSQPAGRLYPTPKPRGEITDAVRAEVEIAQQANIDRALAENPVALVHMHGLEFGRYRIPEHIPVLVTLHLPPAWYPESIWSLLSNYHFVCVSESERKACPDRAQHRIVVVQNGVRLPPETSLQDVGRYALMLSRICAEKNLHTGLDAARRAGMPALLGGEVFPYPDHQRYFREEIEPRLTFAGTTHEDRSARSSGEVSARFLGPVTGAAKARLLARAACLLLPSLAPETSSLVAMEALAAGIPVVAMGSGAVPEIIEDGRTGFLIDPASADPAGAMAKAIGRVPTLDRRICRKVAEERFALDRMVATYGSLYRSLALRQPASLSADADRGVAHLTQRAAPPTVAVEHLTESDDLIRLAPEWIRLWEADRNATPFQHPAWLLPWWRQFGPDGELHALALREHGCETAAGLLGFVPFYVYREPDTGERKLLLVGAGTSDYLDGVFSPDGSPEWMAEAALNFVGTQLRCWDTMSLMQLRTGSALLAAAQAADFEAGLSQTPAEPCSILATADPLPPKVCANVRRYRRRADAAGVLQFSVAESEAEVLASFEFLAALHRARWEARGEPGVLADERVLAHHREGLPELVRSGIVRMFRLTLDGAVLGVLHALADPPNRLRRTLYLYLIGFDPHRAGLSPGTLLLHHVWEYARSEGFTHLDLLRGGESYKQLWGVQTELTFGVHGRRGE